ncbi:c-type cytochrome [Stenotrophomonas sp. 22385]|uniref:c-type cytochrome n=1 Tax=Stenotrophomonas sp. 22385 TaxID=3453915 RepID=UPI003F868EA3
MSLPRVFLVMVCGLLLGACERAPQTPEQARERERQRAFAICGGCHTVNAGGVHRFGPNLHGVIGRRAGSVAGYPYSPAMQRADLVWTEQTLDAFLRSPAAVVPGSRMVNATADPERRRLVIEYLKEQP